MLDTAVACWARRHGFYSQRAYHDKHHLAHPVSLRSPAKEKSQEEAKLIIFHIHYLIFFGHQISVEPFERVYLRR